MKRLVFPFSAVVGQQQVKQALLIAAVNPKAGGVLLAGEKGTAKSTLARGLSQILTAARFIELPLNATDDMVFGSLDLEQAIQAGQRRVLPGLLARAHGNLLYMDEINLMRRDLANAIADVAAAGACIVEREGISCHYPARFIMIGTMNPEEGELPGQLLDKFGLYVAVSGEKALERRVEVVKRLLEYESDPLEFSRRYRQEEYRLQQQLVQAVERLACVELADAMLQLAAQICSQANCAGHRAELFLLETARAIAALNGRNFVVPDDIMAASSLVLPHRLRQERETAVSPPPVQAPEPQSSETQAEKPSASPPAAQESSGLSSGAGGREQQTPAPQGTGGESTVEIGEIPQLGKLQLPRYERKLRKGSGKRSVTRTHIRQGRYVRAQMSRQVIGDLAVDATLRAAAPYQQCRPRGRCRMTVYRQDWREKVREKRIGSTFLFVVDASGSMGATQRMRAVKGAVLAMLRDAYQKRDRVGIVAFRRMAAEILLPVTRSIELGQKCLRQMPTGGKTPLAEGLYMAADILRRLRYQDEDVEPVVVLVTDGRANSAGAGQDAVAAALAAAVKLGKTGVRSMVIDTEQDFIKLGIACKLAHALGGSYYKLEELSAGNIIRIINQIR